MRPLKAFTLVVFGVIAEALIFFGAFIISSHRTFADLAKKYPGDGQIGLAAFESGINTGLVCAGMALALGLVGWFVLRRLHKADTPSEFLRRG
jgi:hypothetical protein